MSVLVIVGIVVGVLLVVIVGMYNRFITLRTRVTEAASDIEVQFKRRFDLIPNLIETVKGYANFEQSTLMKVTEARTAAMGAQGLTEEMKAQDTLGGTLKSLFAVSENYPDLKANQNFLELQRELTDTENKILSARRFYNTNVRDFTVATQQFPSNIIAGIFGFKAGEFFELPEGQEAAAEPVKVNFN
ncbi:MAG: Protein LemA [Candidatus Parcubacteria bacterium]|jgi:LemA protein